jgi:hypothetical protein
MLKLVTLSGPKNTWKVIQALSSSESLSLSLLVSLCSTHALNMLQLMEMWNVTIMSYSDNHWLCACVCVCSNSVPYTVKMYPMW